MFKIISIWVIIFHIFFRYSSCAFIQSVFEEKPGECPLTRGFHSCSFECSSDFDCYGTQKCCITRCGTKCMWSQRNFNVANSVPKGKKFQKFNAETSIPVDKCPSVKFNSTSCANAIDKCSSKNDCQSGQLCCRAECGKRRCVKNDAIKTLSARRENLRFSDYGYYGDYGFMAYAGYGEGLQPRVPFTYGSRFNPVLGFNGYGGLGRLAASPSRLPQFNFSP